MTRRSTLDLVIATLAEANRKMQEIEQLPADGLTIGEALNIGRHVRASADRTYKAVDFIYKLNEDK